MLIKRHKQFNQFIHVIIDIFMWQNVFLVFLSVLSHLVLGPNRDTHQLRLLLFICDEIVGEDSHTGPGHNHIHNPLPCSHSSDQKSDFYSNKSCRIQTSSTPKTFSWVFTTLETSKKLPQKARGWSQGNSCQEKTWSIVFVSMFEVWKTSSGAMSHDVLTAALNDIIIIIFLVFYEWIKLFRTILSKDNLTPYY